MSTFHALCAVVIAFAVSATAVIAFFLTAAALQVLPQIFGWTGNHLAWLIVLTLAAGLGYIATGAIFREAFTRVRYLIPASQVRGLWLALDTQLRHVVGVERGTEQAARFGVGAAAVMGVSLSLAVAGQLLPAAFAFCSLGILVSGEATCHGVALRNATHATIRPAPKGLWETYVVVFGLGVGAGAAALIGTDWTMAADLPRNALSWLQLDILVPVTIGLVGLGIATAIWTVVRLDRAWRNAGDVPLLGFDDPSVVETRWTLGSRSALPTAGGAVAWGTGSMTLQPAVVLLFRYLLAVAAMAVGATIVLGPLVDLVNIPGVALETVIRAAAVLGIASLAEFVCAMTVISSGHEVKLWHYRTLWEHGINARSLWVSHLAGSLIQVAVVALAVAVGVGAIVGRFPWELVAVALAVPLSEHLGESLLARPSRGDGDQRATNAALVVVGFALTLPAIVAGISGGVWVQLLLVYLIILALGGLWCFDLRLKTLPVLTAP